MDNYKNFMKQINNENIQNDPLFCINQLLDPLNFSCPARQRNKEKKKK